MAFLAKDDAYGYSITQQLKGALEVSESTLYPVMRRLQNENCLTVYDLPSNGRNRRYYRLTNEGRDRLNVCRKDWVAFKKVIDGILTYEGEHGNE